MRGVGDKVAHLFLGSPADLEGMIDAGGHLVECDRQSTDLITSLRHGDPLFVVAGRKGSGRGGHLVERVERPGDDQRTQESGHQQYEQRANDGEQAVCSQRLVDLGRRDRELRDRHGTGAVSDHVEDHQIVRRAIASGRQVIGPGLTPGGVDVGLGRESGNLFCPQAGRRQRDLPTVQVEDGRRRIARAQFVGELLGEDERAQRRRRPAGVGLAESGENGVVLAGEHIGVGSK